MTATATATARLDLDPRLASDPVGLICELVERYGEADAVDMWIWATIQLKREQARLVDRLRFVIQQQGARP